VACCRGAALAEPIAAVLQAVTVSADTVNADTVHADTVHADTVKAVAPRRARGVRIMPAVAKWQRAQYGQPGLRRISFVQSWTVQSCTMPQRIPLSTACTRLPTSRVLSSLLV